MTSSCHIPFAIVISKEGSTMKLSMVGIVVKDMQKAITFYEFLGLTVNQKYSEDYVELNNSTVRISLNTQKMVKEIYGFEPKLSGERIELAFELEKKAQVDEQCQKLAKAGYQVFKQPWQAPWGQYYSLVKDCDGNLLSIFSNE